LFSIRCRGGGDFITMAAVFMPPNLEENRELAEYVDSERQWCIVFLDPDTGLESQNSSLDHVLNDETSAIWNNMKNGDVFVFYQHRTNRAGQPWIEPKRNQLAEALHLRPDAVKMAQAPDIANDVVFFFSQKA
jgi:hypothetical protein